LEEGRRKSQEIDDTIATLKYNYNLTEFNEHSLRKTLDEMTCKQIEFTPASLRDTKFPRAVARMSRDKNYRTLEEFQAPSEIVNISLQETLEPSVNDNERLIKSAPPSLTLDDIQNLNVSYSTKSTLVENFLQRNSEQLASPELKGIARGIYSPSTGIDISRGSPHNSNLLSDESTHLLDDVSYTGYNLRSSKNINYKI
jgi:hypothetical protein